MGAAGRDHTGHLTQSMHAEWSGDVGGPRDTRPPHCVTRAGQVPAPVLSGCTSPRFGDAPPELEHYLIVQTTEPSVGGAGFQPGRRPLSRHALRWDPLILGSMVSAAWTCLLRPHVLARLIMNHRHLLWELHPPAAMSRACHGEVSTLRGPGPRGVGDLLPRKPSGMRLGLSMAR